MQSKNANASRRPRILRRQGCAPSRKIGNGAVVKIIVPGIEGILPSKGKARGPCAGVRGHRRLIVALEEVFEPNGGG